MPPQKSVTLSPSEVNCILVRVRNQRGQATILIGIIFQFVFIFFAMVINVGLLVNDKINLQNSVDLAAYYGAMKQAEVLNTMAQVNYQIRQSWKLFNWRLWALGDIGRNPLFKNSDGKAVPYYSAALAMQDSALGWGSNPGDSPYPVVCARNPFWAEEDPNQNLCKKADFQVPNLQPFKPGPVSTGLIGLVLLPFVQQTYQNSNNFGGDCERGANFNLYFASTILVSYKQAVAVKRNAMRDLQKLLIRSSSDFSDISGQSVSTTVNKVLRKNLTVAIS